MIRKIFKWILWVLIGITGLLLLISILVYLPPVQSFIKNKASSIVRESTGMQLNIDRFRLRFPLSLSIDNAVLITPQQDTLVRAGEIRADVALWPLLAGRVKARELNLRQAGVHYVDTLSTLELKAVLDEFTLRNASMGLRNSQVQVSGAAISRADIGLWMGESHKPDTINVDTVPALWNIRLSRLDLKGVRFRMETSPTVTQLTVDLPAGRIDNAAFDLPTQEVTAGLIRFQRGNYAYLTDTTTIVPAPVVLTSDMAAESPMAWKFKLNRLELTDNAFTYGELNGRPRPGFDPDHIQLTGINVDIRDARYRSDELGGTIRTLAARERSGLEVTRGGGEFLMDSVHIALSGFSLETPNSSLAVEADLALGILRQNPDAPLSATVRAGINPVDLYYFINPEPSLRRSLSGQRINVAGDFSGTLSQLAVRSLTANMPGRLDFHADGRVLNLTEPERIGADIRLNGIFHDLDFVRPLLPDSLRTRIGFPNRMTLAGTVKMASNNYAPNLRLTADNGTLDVRGTLNLNRQSYQADITATDFPLYSFLPQDSLGVATFDLTASGNSFDPRREGASADIDLQVARFDYNSYTYHDITVDLTLADHLLDGQLSSESEAAMFDFDLAGEFRPEKYAAHLTGRVDTLDLQRLGFSVEPFNTSMQLDAELAYWPDTTYRADIVIDSIRLQHRNERDRISRTTIQAEANTDQMTAAVNSGDLKLDFNAPVGLDSLLSSVNRMTDEINRQIDARSLDMEELQQFMPPFRLDASAGQRNLLHSMLKTSGLDFRSLTLTASTLNDKPFRAGMVINSLETGSLTLDTLNVGLARRDKQLAYFARLANKPGNIEQMALIAVAGNVEENRAKVNVYQRNRADSIGFRFGLDAELQDSAIRATLTPERPIFGYVPWQVNPDNYVVYHFDQQIEADVRLEGPEAGQHVYITSAPLEPSMPTGAVKLDMAGIDIGTALEMLPSSPAFGGTLSTDIGFGFYGSRIVASGNVGVRDLTYDKRRVGNLGLDVDFQSDSLDRYVLIAGLNVDSQTVLTAKGAFSSAADSGLSLSAVMQSFPLVSLNPFLPEDAARLEGTLSGSLDVSGTSAHPVANGDLRFADGKLTVPLIGTTFGLEAGPVSIDDSTLDLSRFSLVSPNNQRLTIDGTVNFSDLTRLVADLSIEAQNFEVISSTSNDESQIYGNAPVDVDITAKGATDALVVRGDIRLRRGTDVTYTIEEQTAKVQSVKQDIVTFVDFEDPATLVPDTTRNISVFGMDMLVNIDIEENINVTVNISEDGNNRAEVAGYGNLTYTLNTQGDSRFTGRFDVASGRILYNPPIITQKDFAINPDSYVEWTGEMLNPTFDITAQQSISSTVTLTDRTTENVTFQAMILIRNNLENVELTFDLSAPNSAVITNDLAQMTPEQRMQQAISLLAYNRYTGPSATGSGNVNDPLNTFITRELNQWTRNNLQGVDLSLGLNTVDGEDGTHTNYSYQVSKSFMDDRVKVTVGGNVDPDATGEENLQNNFVQDVSVEYRLTERDNMYLRAFRNLTQESMLESEVIETGVGFLLRKRMNKLGDLFKLMPKEQRRERRQIRRQLRDARDDDPDPAKDQRQEPIIDDQTQSTV